MSNNELQINDNSVTYSVGSVEFNDYERIKESAIKLADRVKTVEVNEDNVKESKKLRAAVNKEVAALNKQRTAIKKELLKPYEDFNNQVKEISNIVGGANNTIDKQISDLELQEKDAKRNEIKRMYGLHLAAYYGFPIDFEKFIIVKPKLLNKSVTLDKAEEAIAQFLHDKNEELKTIDSQTHSDEVLAEYLSNGLNLSTAINAVSARLAAVEKVKRPKSKPVESLLAEYGFKVFDEKDALLIQMYMKENNIKFEKVNK